MEGLTKLMEVGKELGLNGKELLEFIEKRDALEREKEEKRIAREDKKEAERLARDTERNENERKMQLDKLAREERMKERELKYKELEVAQQEQVSKLKIQLAEREIELAELHKESGKKLVSEQLSHSDPKAKLPKLPAFCEGKDDMDSYLKRFERFATNANWPKEKWATNLSVLLQGKALDVYSRLSFSDAVNYDTLRDALLKRYRLTEEGFRLKFRNSKQEVGETANQFVVRLANYLSRWMELGKVTESFEGLKDLILREQFLAVSNKNLVMFLKERKLGSVKEMTELADQYIEAHSASDSMFRLSLSNKPDAKFEVNRSNQFRSSVSENNSQSLPLKDRVCYNCGKKDHFIKNCPYKASVRSGTNVKAAVLKADEETVTLQSGGTVENEPETETQDTLLKSVATCIVLTSVNEIPLVSQSRIKVESKLHSSSLSLLNIMNSQSKHHNMPVMYGYVGERKVSVLRDSGCNSAIIKETLVQNEQLKNYTQTCVLADGTVRNFPVACVKVDTPYFTGDIEVLCMANPVYDLVIGNIEGVRSADNPDINWCPSNGTCIKALPEVLYVETRAQRLKQNKENVLHIPRSIKQFSRVDIIEGQTEDENLVRCKSRAETGEKVLSRNGSFSWFVKEKDMFYRKFQCRQDDGRVFKQLLVPNKLKNEVLKLAHDSILSGHFGVRKMKAKVLSEFWWPGLERDVRNYCKSCDVCQKTVAKGKVGVLPLGKMPVIDTPFARVAIDIIGPIHPPSESGNRFILTVVDYATRYPEAKALKRIDTETVAEALVEVYSRVGVPREILTDQGKQFTSDLMKEIGRLLSIKQLTTTPYHPSCNGLVERFNGTLKSMLRRISEEKPKQWDRYIPALLFAYRESIQESTGFSPFELLYGRQVRGPMTILRELWTKEIDNEDIKTTYQYVLDLKERLESTCEIARANLEKSSKIYKAYADSKSKDRQFKVGDDVLLLLPNNLNKLIMQWQGPYKIVERLNQVDYKINVRGKIKTYHGNMLKRYYSRGTENSKQDGSNVISLSCVSVIEQDDPDKNSQVSSMFFHGSEIGIQFPTVDSKETISDVRVNTQLDAEQKAEVSSLLSEYSDVFTDIPGTTDIAQHNIVVTSTQPVRCKPYPVPYALKQDIKKEIDNMLKLGIIEPCTSAYAAPVVIVKKPDGSNRFCCDFRKLNKVTVFDAEPIGNPDELFARMSKSRFFTKIDLSKGYWQIKVKKSSQHLTAFITSEGLYSFKKMPFGLVNAGATFCRMMRTLLRGLEDTDNFVDDLLVHTETWKRHIEALRALLERLRNARLTARPTKCVIAVREVGFLGHVVGDGIVRPNPEKVSSILQCKRPTTKKQVRSFIGLIGYYRKFIPNFSTVSAPLTDLTKKGQPTKVRWDDEQEMAFEALLTALGKSPILCLPNFDTEFIVRTDASDIGLGAVLLQEYDGYKFPVYYASKKLLERERAYSVVEKECYAVIWAVQKFQSYLYGKQFVLETDHEPLIYLNQAKCANARLMRWALALQPFSMRIVSIKGSENAGADFLSRMA